MPIEKIECVYYTKSTDLVCTLEKETNNIWDKILVVV